MRTAVCISGAMTDLSNFENHKKHIIDPYGADVFIATWIPDPDHSMQLGSQPKSSPTIGNWGGIDGYAFSYKPRLMNLEYFDGMPLKHQIRSVIPKGEVNTRDGGTSPGTKLENVFFMFYKVWQANYLRKMYEQCNRIRYDVVIRLRFDNSFDSFPMIDPKRRTLYVPDHGDHRGGLMDQCALGDVATMDTYCDLYNDIYRYSVANKALHPESLLRTHIEVNRIALERFKCGMKLRGVSIG